MPTGRGRATPVHAIWHRSRHAVVYDEDDGGIACPERNVYQRATYARRRARAGAGARALPTPAVADRRQTRGPPANRRLDVLRRTTRQLDGDRRHEQLAGQLASRQRAWPTTLVVSCLIEGAHADDLAGEFAQQKRPGGTFAVKGALRKFLAEHRLSQPVALRNLSQPIALRNLTRYPMHPNSPEAATSDELHNGMPMWELQPPSND